MSLSSQRIHTISSKKKRVKPIAAALFCSVLMLLLVIEPAPALDGARNGLSLCGSTVIPSLFPFLVLASFIIQSGIAQKCGRLLEGLTRRVFRLPGCAGAALLLGAIGGYPVGAKATAELCEKGLLTKSEGERLLCCCINSSPAFIIGAVGAGFFGSAQAGVLLFSAHLAASFCVGIAMGFITGCESRRKYVKGIVKPRNFTRGVDAIVSNSSNTLGSVSYAGAFVSSVTGSAQSIITISAFVVLFSSASELMSRLGVTNAAAVFLGALLPRPAGDPMFYGRAFTGIFEVTNGCAAASGAGGMPALILTAVILGFCGLSVQFQVLSMIRKAGLNGRAFILTRLLHMPLSALFTCGLFTALPEALPKMPPAAEAFASSVTTAVAAFHPVPAVCAMLFICAILLLSLAKV